MMNPTGKDAPRRLSPWTKSVLAGSVSGMASVVVCHPFDTIRTRLQISPQRFRGFFHCASLTIQRESVLGLYKGFLPPFFSQAVYKSVIFTVSSRLRNDVLPSCSVLQPVLTPSSISLISGAVAGGLNAFLVTPVELVRNRLQVQYENDRATRRYRGTAHCVTQVLKQEGLLAFWRGLSTTVLRDSLGVACYFLGAYLRFDISVDNMGPDDDSVCPQDIFAERRVAHSSETDKGGVLNYLEDPIVNRAGKLAEMRSIGMHDEYTSERSIGSGRCKAPRLCLHLRSDKVRRESGNSKISRQA
ncbi:hypothetical protein P43SY_002870 [Pythium insidiosum]|uniref:Mitochondrial Carrier (MC) Family n=1 Tax=Pythium insidiosum TaxID=114742 RepID=A0AAD5QAG9_PYTIN|nr:hypothetical protein P43SY_002870 [Pythium insidiosum]